MKRSNTKTNNKGKSPFSLRLKHFLYKLQGVPIEIDLSSYKKILAQIKTIDLKSLTDLALKQKSAALKEQVRSGVSLKQILPESFALVSEVSRRKIGLDPHDVQIIAGIALFQGKIAELPTGEGKTLAAVFPAYLNALKGKGFHVLTFNDYLARRDAAWMGPIYSFLGLTVGCIQEGMKKNKKRKAYKCDITYAAAKEVGFDFLRDNLCYKKENLVLRPFQFALVDEADSILIDEARIPLIIAGITGDETSKSYLLADIIRQLKDGLDYETDVEKRNVFLTDKGIKYIEKHLNCSNLHAPENLDLLTAINCALHAEVLLKRDRDYIVRGRKIEIVDEFTGRVVDKRHWPDGLQAAVEAKEDLKFKSDGTILGSITMQHFFHLYPNLCGMTATARSAAGELKEFYSLSVTVIPAQRPCIRIDHPDRIFKNIAAKTQALIKEIKSTNATCRPILVGTGSIAESEQIAAELTKTGIDCQVLNAKNDEKEAQIIAQAGDLGAVTISTNMAGRGTDIKLGGEQENNHHEVVSLGGLYVIGTNRHESLRIDNQLRGRAGRQGDSGTSRFFISLEDDLVKKFGVKKYINRLVQLLNSENEEITIPLIRREIILAQHVMEGQNFEIRKTLWNYSYLIEMQRQTIHRRRHDIFHSNSLSIFLKQRSSELYKSLINFLGEKQLWNFERQVSLVQLDRSWAIHLAYLADVKESIHLVGLGGKMPVEEFHKSATDAFLEMEEKIGKKIESTFQNILSSKKKPDLSDEEFQGPSSTWTYLVNDEQFGWGIEMLKGRNIGFTAGAAAWYGPLFMLLGIYHRFFKKRKE